MAQGTSDYSIQEASVALFTASADVTHRVTIALVVVGVVNDASRALQCAIMEALEEEFLTGSDTERHDNLKDWASVVPLVINSDAIVLLFNKKPTVYIQPLLLLTMKRRMANKVVALHLVDNWPSRAEAGEWTLRDLLQHPRVRDQFQSVVKLTGDDDGSKLRDLSRTIILGLTKTQVPNNNASTGEAFAWNFATTFLRLVVPDLETRIIESLQDGDRLSESKLRKVGIQLRPERILPLHKYFVLVPDTLDQEVSPDVLFPGCVKTGILLFEGLGYQRKVFIYLMQLDERTPSGQTHAVIFADWASPIFTMRDMSIEPPQGQDIAEVREAMFSQFKDSLKLIINHPSFRKQLFSGTSDCSSKLELIEVTSPETLRGQMEIEVEQFASLATCYLQQVPAFSVQVNDQCDLLVKMSNRISSEDEILAVTQAFNETLRSRCKIVGGNESMPKSVDSFRRVLFILSLEDVRSGAEDFEIKLAAEKMSKAGKCCVSVIIVGDFGVGLEAVHDVLPDRLKHLPYCCVAAVRSLTGDDVEGRLPFGKQLRTLADVVDGLHLFEEECLKLEEVFPLISMAGVLTANIVCDFLDKMSQYIRNESSEGRDLPFDRPYFYVLPASHRFPEPTALEESLAGLGAQKVNENFIGSNGRPYNYQVWHWQSLKLAFEIPVQFSYLREQLDWGFSGLISPQQVDDILEEFGRGLEEHCRHHGFVKTVRWDDEQGDAARLLQLLEGDAGQFRSERQNQFLNCAFLMMFTFSGAALQLCLR